MGGMMQHAVDAFTGFAVLTGLGAARLWLVASKVQIVPDRETLDRARGLALVAVAHAKAAREAWERSGALNSRAAKWTAASVALQTVATVLGRFVPPSP